MHGIMVVSEEADVLPWTLAAHLDWADTLWVCDLGGSDGTSELLHDWAAQDDRIRVLFRPTRHFHNGLRAWVFDRVRHEFAAGDWIGIADADEVFHVSPREFVTSSASPEAGSVHSLHLEFVLTQTEALALEDPDARAAERMRPIELRRRWFAPSKFGEFRLFRYRSGMRWPVGSYSPRFPGLAARERIPVRHYRARDPEQLRRRCALRQAAAKCRGPEHHWHLSWQDLICPTTAGLLHWSPGTDLDWGSFSVPDPPKGLKRAAQEIWYRGNCTLLGDLLAHRFDDSELSSAVGGTEYRR